MEYETDKDKIMNNFLRIAEKLMLLFPDWITGKREVMEQKYYLKYGSKDCNLLIRISKTHIMASYMIIALIFTGILIFLLIDQLSEKDEIKSILKPLYGEAAQTIPMEVRVKYKNHEFDKDITIKVGHKELSKSGKTKTA